MHHYLARQRRSDTGEPVAACRAAEMTLLAGLAVDRFVHFLGL
jgi:hypothetical protein